jgi:hypothetical protein
VYESEERIEYAVVAVATKDTCFRWSLLAPFLLWACVRREAGGKSGMVNDLNEDLGRDSLYSSETKRSRGDHHVKASGAGLGSKPEHA